MPGVWRGRRIRRGIPALPTGHARLDRRLPGRGWPLGALTELLAGTPGSGELSLLLPSLADVTARGHWVVLIDPPWVPYPPAMHGHGIALERVMLIRTASQAESLWACEQALRGVPGGAVLAWQEDPGFTRLRRLQLAAKAGHKAAFMFRPLAAAGQSSPAALRLRLDADAGGTRVTVFKCRGRRPDRPVLVRRSRHLPGVAALAAANPPPSLHSGCPLLGKGALRVAIHADDEVAKRHDSEAEGRLPSVANAGDFTKVTFAVRTPLPQ
jgi:cell division inhibitor SulA